jgi:tRNA(Ile)-lysidine synthase
MERQRFAARVWGKLIAHEKEHALLPRGASVLAAVSGGPDSVALAHYLSQRARPLGLSVRVLHVHHGLRGRAADADAAFVLRLAAALGLPASVVRVDARAAAARRGAGLEDAARALRYAALSKEARRRGCSVVAAGHHLDDQAETVLLNLLRGTRLSALGAIAPSRPLAAGVALVRPLLPLSRAEVMTYLARHDLPHRRDRTNDSEAFARNWLRRSVLPALEKRQPRVKEHLAGIAAQVRALSGRTVGDP